MSHEADTWQFQRDAIAAFRFVRATLDEASGKVELVYAFDDGPELVETLQFPGAPFTLDAPRRAAVDATLQLLHLIAGVSYYKAALPPQLLIETALPSPALAALATSVYENGLSEFAYRNGLSVRGRIQFPAAEATPSAPVLGLRVHALTAIGGGKDSLVTIEALRDAGVAQSVVFVGNSPLIQACAQRTGLPLFSIGRKLAPQLFDYNKQGAWNGHIPVTAVNSAILVLAALLHDADQVVFSNERSASYGSQVLLPDGSGSGEV